MLALNNFEVLLHFASVFRSIAADFVIDLLRSDKSLRTSRQVMQCFGYERSTKVKWSRTSDDDCLIFTFYGRWQVFASVKIHLQLELLLSTPINHRTRWKFQLNREQRKLTTWMQIMLRHKLNKQNLLPFFESSSASSSNDHVQLFHRFSKLMTDPDYLFYCFNFLSWSSGLLAPKFAVAPQNINMCNRWFGGSQIWLRNGQATKKFIGVGECKIKLPSWSACLNSVSLPVGSRVNLIKFQAKPQKLVSFAKPSRQ